MGKEAKIGLAVILVLVITFGVVVARRMLLPKQEAPTIAEERERDRERGHTPLGEERLKGHTEPVREPSRPTILPAKIPASQMVRRTPLDADSMAAERGAEHGGRDASRSSVPSLMPSQRLTEAEERRGRPGAAAAEESNRAYDPFESHRRRPGNADAEDDPGVSALRVVDASGRREPSTGGRYGEERSSGPYGRGPGQVAGVGEGERSRYSIDRDDERLRRGSLEAEERRERREGPGGIAAYEREGAAGRWGRTAAVARMTSKDGRRDNGTYEIQPNDTYWTISEKVYGTGAYFRALAEHNRKKVPQEDQLTVGEVISTPDVAQLEKAHPDLCPKSSHRDVPKRPAGMVSATGRYPGGRTYSVQEGDTLYDIARNELGKASRWVEIYELNRDQLGADYNYLPRGLQLVMPGNESDGTVTRRPRAEPFQR